MTPTGASAPRSRRRHGRRHEQLPLARSLSCHTPFYRVSRRYAAFSCGKRSAAAHGRDALCRVRPHRPGRSRSRATEAPRLHHRCHRYGLRPTRSYTDGRAEIRVHPCRAKRGSVPSVVKAEEEEFTTEHTERPKAVTEHTEGVGYVGEEGPRISVRDAPQKAKFRSILSVPYLQLWVLIGNWIYYALKSHLEVCEGMTAPASPSQMDPDRRATSSHL